jgi:LDH2 family malate/lactate/ureidoglycolate dehydrogenase
VRREALPESGDDFEFVIIARDPSKFLPLGIFKNRAEEFAAGMRTTAPVAGFGEVRMPFDRSLRKRKRRRVEGIQQPRVVYARLDSIRRRTR